MESLAATPPNTASRKSIGIIMHPTLGRTPRPHWHRTIFELPSNSKIECRCGDGSRSVFRQVAWRCSVLLENSKERRLMNRIEPKMPWGIHRDLAIVAISEFIWGLGEGLFIFFLPLALQRWNSDAVQIGAVLSMIGATMAVVQVPAGYLSARFATRPLIFASLLLGIASAIVMAAARSLPFFVAGLLAYGCTSFISAPMNSYVTSLRGSWTIQRAVTFRAAAFRFGVQY